MNNLILMTFDRNLSAGQEAYIDRAVKSVDSDAFCHGGHLGTRAHIGYDDVEIDGITRRAILTAARKAKEQVSR